MRSPSPGARLALTGLLVALAACSAGGSGSGAAGRLSLGHTGNFR